LWKVQHNRKNFTHARADEKNRLSNFNVGYFTGRKETRAELLMSIMAIYLFRWEVQKLKELPDNHANFSDFLYQPEKDEDTNEYVHHREDHNHVLKRLVNCLREGVIPGIDLRYFRDALHDANTGLTYESLTGKNKQSVPDCERLISPAVVSFLREKGDVRGASILSIISNWHKAVDGRSLSEEERSSYLADMKNWLLDDWMPWHRNMFDFATIDVNRLVTQYVNELFFIFCCSIKEFLKCLLRT
jgi:hypothetical protein